MFYRIIQRIAVLLMLSCGAAHAFVIATTFDEYEAVYKYKGITVTSPYQGQTVRVGAPLTVNYYPADTSQKYFSLFLLFEKTDGVIGFKQIGPAAMQATSYEWVVSFGNSSQYCTGRHAFIVVGAGEVAGMSGIFNISESSGNPTLDSITISGITSVNESSSAQYSCYANYSDGSFANVTGQAIWSDNSGYASISANGILTSTAVSADQTCTITASYGGKTDTHTVTIKNGTSSVSLDSIEISGSRTVNENSTSQYACWAYYSDGSSVNVTGQAIWSDNSGYASISANGILTSTAVSADQTCTITANYSGKNDTHIVTIKNSASLTVSPTSVEFGAAASSTSFDVVANVSWTSQAGDSWIGITNGSSGSGNGSVAFNVTSNSGTGPRGGVITVYGGSVTQIFNVSQQQSVPDPDHTYMVIDISGGRSAKNYYTSYLDSVPAGGWTDEYKTSKIVLRKITAGTFVMGSPINEYGRYSSEMQHTVKLTKDYYIGVFEITQRQWELVMGNRPSYFNNTAYYTARPVETVSFSNVRGSVLGVAWPSGVDVDASSFMGVLRTKTKMLTCDLPTEAQWEYACRAGVATALNSGANLTNTNSCPNMSKVGRYWYNGGSSSTQNSGLSAATAKVGSYVPNRWGLYDMHGNVLEWCLDRYGAYQGSVTDPNGSLSGTNRVMRGGAGNHIARNCRSATRWMSPTGKGGSNVGFRLAIMSTRQVSLSGDLVFGGVVIGQTATRELIIRNSGNSVLTVTGYERPAGFGCNWTGNIEAGGTRSVVVTFSPSDVNNYSGTMKVLCNGSSGSYTINCTGTGLPRPTAGINLVASPNAGGCVYINNGPASARYAAGTNVTLKAVANTDWRFVSWSDGVTTSERLFKVPCSDVTLTAKFVYEAVMPPDAPIMLNCTQYKSALEGRIDGFFRPVTGADSYEVFRSDRQNEIGGPVAVSVSEYTDDALKFRHDGLPQGDKAWYRVRAVSSGVASAFSAAAYGETRVGMSSVKVPTIRIVGGETNAAGAFRGSVTIDIVGYRDDLPIRYRLSNDSKTRTFSGYFDEKVTNPGESRTFGIEAWQEENGDRTGSGTDILLNRGVGPSVKTVTVVAETVEVSGAVKCADGSAASGYAVSFGGKTTNTDSSGRFKLVVAWGSQGYLTIPKKNGHQDVKEALGALNGNTSVGTYVLIKTPRLKQLDVTPGKTRVSGRVEAKWNVDDPSRLISSYRLVIYADNGVVYDMDYPSTTRTAPIVASVTPGRYSVIVYAYYALEGEARSQSKTASFNVVALDALKRERVEATTTESASVKFDGNIWTYPYKPNKWEMDDKAFFCALKSLGEDDAGAYVSDPLDIDGLASFSEVYGIAGFDLSAEAWWSGFMSGLGVEVVQGAKLYLWRQKINKYHGSESINYLNIGGRADESFSRDAAANLKGWSALSSTSVDSSFWNNLFDTKVMAELDPFVFKRMLDDTRTESGRLYISVQSSSGLAVLLHGTDAPDNRKSYLELDFSYTRAAQAQSQSNEGGSVSRAALSADLELPDYTAALDWYSDGKLTELGVLSAAIDYQAFDASFPEDMAVSRHLSSVTDYSQEQTVRIEITVPEGRAIKSGILVESIPDGYQYVGLDATGEACRADEMVGGRLALHFVNLASGAHVQEYRLIPIMGLPVPITEVDGTCYFVDECNRVGVQTIAGDRILMSLVDTDSDGLSDGDEIRLGTGLFEQDTDGDEVTDGAEVAAGTDPLDPKSCFQRPVITKRTPTANPATVNEGASVAFSVTADDSTDPDRVTRGMSNVTWYVDGVLRQETKTGAPNAINSTFSFKTDSKTVLGVVNRDVIVSTVALDRQGMTSGTNWALRVNNVPASQAITFKALPVMALGGTNYNLGASSSSGMPVVYSNSNPAVAQIVEGELHIVGAGTAVITATQPGNFDFKPATPVKQTLTVKAVLTAVTPNGGGTVSGIGLYVPGTKVALAAKPVAGNTFLRWEDGSQATARSLTMPNANTTVSAWFGLTTSVPKPTIADSDPQRAIVGVPFTLPISIISESLPTVTVTGLPSGLAYVPASKSIAGVPKVSVTNKVVTVKAVNVNKVPGTNTFAITVDPLPVWAQGTFNGASGKDALGLGSASMSVTALGAATGKLTLRGTNLSFSAKSYASHEADGSFTFVSTAVVGKVSYPLTVAVSVPEVTDTTGIVPPTLGKADGVLSTDGWMTLYRNVWKDAGMVTALTNNFAGYYTSALPGGAEYGSGYLTFTVDKAGGVKTVGKLADGTTVSLSGTLILDEAGRAWTVLYTAPAPYKGGGLFGLAEFFKGDAGSRVIVRLLDGEPFLWQNLSPTASQTYGTGFNRELGIVGGWFDTVGNLYGYYSNRVISTGTDAPAPVPEISVGTKRYDAIWWDPDGITLSVVTNKLGVMTGLSAPGIGTPVKDGTAYDYENPTNAVGLTVALTRATGVFRGSFKAWFDYATTHTPKTVAYEGVLTPVREDTSDGVAGRGFFLWADKSQYLNPLNKPVPYNFSWSYDFKILLSE